MSKIQKALTRMRSERGRTDDQSADAHDGGRRIARIAIGEKALAEGASESTHGVVVHVDQQALQTAGLIAPDYHEELLADQYRDIKRPLIANAYGKRVAKVENGNLIMVTSALPGEGKTFTALNLAISIAQEQDLTVLLVDADVAKPHVSNVFGVGEMPGLLDALESDQQGPERLIVPTDINGLSILPAGAPRSNATELLSGSKMENLIQHFAAQDPQRMVIFDTPPLLRTSESKVLTDMAGQVVLVVKAESTSYGAVGEALHVLGEEKAVNLVLNQARKAGSASQYEYGYGYSHGASEAG